MDMVESGSHALRQKLSYIDPQTTRRSQSRGSELALGDGYYLEDLELGSWATFI